MNYWRYCRRHGILKLFNLILENVLMLLPCMFLYITLYYVMLCINYCYCRLEFGSTEVNGEEVKTNDILAMLSPEKEKVPLQKVAMHHVILVMMLHHVRYQGLKARGNVEQWLTLVEESMVTSLRKITKAAITDYETKPRHEWATCHPSQVSTCHEQMH